MTTSSGGQKKNDADKAMDKADKTIDQMEDKVDETVGNAQGMVNDMSAEARNKVEASREQAAESVHRAAEAVRAKVSEGGGPTQQAGEKLAGSLDSAAGYLEEHSSGEIWSDVKQYVRMHPGRALFGGIAAGFLLGKIMG